MSLWLVGFLALAMGIRTPWGVDITLLIAAIIGTSQRLQPSLRFLSEIILIAVVVLLTHNTWSIAIQVTMALIALTTARSTRLLADRAIVGALMLVVIATFIRPEAAWAFIAIALIGVWALLSTDHTHSATDQQRIRLAFTLAAVAIGGSLVAGLIAYILPWQTIVATVFSVLAWPFIELLSRIALPHLHPRKPTAPPSPFKDHHQVASLHSHVPVSVTVGLILLAALVLLAILYLAYRYWVRPDETSHDDLSEAGIVRETLDPRDTQKPWSLRGIRLTPVRQLVRSRLLWAYRHQQGRHVGETFQGWLKRTQPHLMQSSVAQTYDHVRYGNSPDSSDVRRQVEEEWPRP